MTRNSGAVQMFESNDDVAVEEMQAPQMFARDNYEWLTFADTGIKFEELPRPTTWHCLVMPKQPRKVSKGGIALPDQVSDVENHLNYIGQVVALGPLAGKSERFLNPAYAEMIARGTADSDINPVKEVPRYLWNIRIGDWVIYGKYAGMNKVFKGVRFLTINDDEITDVIDSPSGFRIYL